MRYEDNKRRGLKYDLARSVLQFWYTGKTVHSAKSLVTIPSDIVCKMRKASHSVEWIHTQLR